MSKTSYKSSEPQIPTLTAELTKSQLTSLLNWYAANYTSDVSAKYFSEYLKSQQIEHTQESVHGFIAYHPNVGYLCRIHMRGAQLPETSLRWLNNQVADFKNFVKPVDLYNDRPKDPVKVEKPVVSVQDRMKQQVSKCLGELEGCLDELILSNFKTAKPPIMVMREHQIKGPQAQQIISWFKRTRDEYRLAHSGTDPDVKEAYNNFTKPELNKIANYCDQIMTDGLLLVKESMDTRSPRKKKKRLPEQVAKRVQYQSNDQEFNLTSVEPAQMVGALYAWTYHTKSRVLTLHVADDASGLTFKGTTVFNTNASMSVSKKLRKPQDTLKEVLNGSKSITKKLMDSLTTKPTKYKNRLNKETIIVRVHK